MSKNWLSRAKKDILSGMIYSYFILRIHIAYVVHAFWTVIFVVFLIRRTSHTWNIKLYLISIILLNRGDIWRMFSRQVSKMTISHYSAVIYVGGFHIWVHSQPSLLSQKERRRSTKIWHLIVVLLLHVWWWYNLALLLLVTHIRLQKLNRGQRRWRILVIGWTIFLLIVC